ncbi:MAG: phosphopantothenate/pantothenate synthetase [Candidatus Nitrosocosmicus sp.]|nr:phosphopantothenate/pantothenate synthetase [Candidatus Nitrosocosmicus sp.]MDN5868439.1 phosphopantothenate/pantothenate synthetase [Candidatus Nitrosocosmicus sp.]
MTRKIELHEGHPRYLSLLAREKLVTGFKKGLVASEGLIAHGRGECFDYLLGECTTDSARVAINVASAMLLLARYPVISVNGNVTALCVDQICGLNRSLESSAVEINLFYYTREREKLISEEFKKYGLTRIFGIDPENLVPIPELESNRRLVDRDGISKADVVFVPLEDGDRTMALKQMDKQVVTVDLNPLSRTALSSDITIVDNIVRVLPQLIECVEYNRKHSSENDLKDLIESFDNLNGLRRALEVMKTKQVPFQ